MNRHHLDIYSNDVIPSKDVFTFPVRLKENGELGIFFEIAERRSYDEKIKYEHWRNEFDHMDKSF